MPKRAPRWLKIFFWGQLRNEEQNEVEAPTQKSLAHV
jgi:hypothetical protein